VEVKERLREKNLSLVKVSSNSFRKSVYGKTLRRKKSFQEVKKKK